MDAAEYPEEFDRLMDNAAEAMEEKEYETALSLLIQAVRLVEDDPEVWQRLGASHFALGDDDAAIDAYRRWWSLAPRNPLAFRATANLLFRVGRLEESEAAALAWLGQETNDPYAFVMVANARYKRGKEFSQWLDAGQKSEPDLFRTLMLDVFDYTRADGPGEWTSGEAAEYLGIPETRLVERAAVGGMPRHYNPETETFTFNQDELDARREVLSRYNLLETEVERVGAVVELDFGTDVDDVEVGQEVRVMLQKCPHCGEWTAGPLGDREKYFCCGAPMDPFIELSGEVEVQGRVTRKAGGGRALSAGIKRLTADQIAELRTLWEDQDDWMGRAEELLAALPPE